MSQKRIYLSPPHMSGREQKYIQEAFESNWIAPLGPNVDAFERDFCQVTGAGHALALNSGTAALHLALILAGVGPEDKVVVSTLTFAASVYPVRYLGADPVFIDCDPDSWNMAPALLEAFLKERSGQGRLPKAVILVHLYGQSADINPILSLCNRYGVVLIEDAAEALGSTYRGKAPGTFGRFGIFSFNGNKILTTSGGGMLVSNDKELITHARKLSAQAREPAPHYEHSEIGYNYRMSNVLAGIGRGQLELLEERVQSRRQNFEYYLERLGHLPGIRFMPEAAWGRHTRWLTTLTIDPDEFGADREKIRQALEVENIEARPVWKPMHLQPVFQDYECVGGVVAEKIFDQGLCLPSGSNLSKADLSRIVHIIHTVYSQANDLKTVKLDLVN